MNTMKHSFFQIGIIAIVDDDEHLREAFGNVMKAAGYSFMPFESAEDFLSSPYQRMALCLILDVRLPGMSGIELQRHLREADDDVPIIFVSANSDHVLRGLLMNAGAFGFLDKPVRGETLVENVRAALQETRPDTKSH